MCCYKPLSLLKFAIVVIEASTPGLVNNGFPGGSDSEESACNAGDPGSVPGLGGSPGEGSGNPPMPVFLPGEFHGQRSLSAIAHGVTKNQT